MKVFENISAYYLPVFAVDKQYEERLKSYLREIIDELIPLRLDESATIEYYKRKKPQEFLKGVDGETESIIDSNDLGSIMLEVLRDDKVSFAYIYRYIVKEKEALAGINIPFVMPNESSIRESCWEIDPNHPFASHLVSLENQREKIKRLHFVFDAKGGKSLAMAVSAAQEKGLLIDRPSFKVLKSEFNVRGTHTGYEKYQYDNFKIGDDSATYRAILEEL